MDNQTKSLGVVNQSPPIKRKSRRPQSSSAEEFGRFLRAIWDSNWLRLILVVWFILWATGVTEKISKHFRTPRQSSLVAEQKLMHQDAMRRADRLPLYLYRQFDESAKALDPSKPSSEANLAEDGTGNSESTTYESGEVEVYDDSEDQLSTPSAKPKKKKSIRLTRVTHRTAKQSDWDDSPTLASLNPRNHRELFNRCHQSEASERARIADAIFREAVAEVGFKVDYNFARAVGRTESALCNQTSHVGARGIMQLMPGTASDIGVSNSWDVEANIKGGVRYLAWLQGILENEQSIDDWCSRNHCSNKRRVKQYLKEGDKNTPVLIGWNWGINKLFNSDNLPSETINFVDRVNYHIQRLNSGST